MSKPDQCAHTHTKKIISVKILQIIQDCSMFPAVICILEIECSKCFLELSPFQKLSVERLSKYLVVQCYRPSGFVLLRKHALKSNYMEKILANF